MMPAGGNDFQRFLGRTSLFRGIGPFGRFEARSDGVEEPHQVGEVGGVCKVNIAVEKAVIHGHSSVKDRG